jgi:hypothetical protein
MFVFPQDKKNRRVWTLKVKRKDWEPSKYSRLCSEHFEEDCFVVRPSVAAAIGYDMKGLRLKKGSVPTIFPQSSAQLKEQKECRRQAFQKRRKLEVCVSDVRIFCH